MKDYRTGRGQNLKAPNLRDTISRTSKSAKVLWALVLVRPDDKNCGSMKPSSGRAGTQAPSFSHPFSHTSSLLFSPHSASASYSNRPRIERKLAGMGTIGERKEGRNQKGGGGLRGPYSPTLLMAEGREGERRSRMRESTYKEQSRPSPSFPHCSSLTFFPRSSDYTAAISRIMRATSTAAD